MCEKTIYCEYKPDDRRVIQKAIDSCPAGGKVVVPVSYTHLTLPTILRV